MLNGDDFPVTRVFNPCQWREAETDVRSGRNHQERIAGTG